MGCLEGPMMMCCDMQYFANCACLQGVCGYCTLQPTCKRNYAAHTCIGWLLIVTYAQFIAAHHAHIIRLVENSLKLF